MKTEELEGLKQNELPSICCRGESKTGTSILKLELKIGLDIITIISTNVKMFSNV